ncbi:hypothetical protein [Lacinutrix jangbogonensis]|uniref:hypothetical protein n=1 Tax=Lacinutrix jangbogonensis TaxID=1469557 RepID=UPI00053EC462|nr:hypothetical protein [Lacinutrix jangbogonensis]
MKLKIILSFLLIGLMLNSCNKNDDNNQNNNPNIPNAVFDTGNLINTSLPQFNQMQFPGNHITLNNNYGVNGVVVYFSGAAYTAFELSDPNHALASCSSLTISAPIATCSCDDGNSYEILSGQREEGTTGQFSLIPYRVEVSGSIIRVFNN